VCAEVCAAEADVQMTARDASTANACAGTFAHCASRYAHAICLLRAHSTALPHHHFAEYFLSARQMHLQTLSNMFAVEDQVGE
jgi:hypothetical protein